MFDNYRDMLTTAEVSVMLRICPSKTYKLLNKGEIKAFRCEKAWCIPKQSVIDYINRKMESDVETKEEK